MSAHPKSGSRPYHGLQKGNHAFNPDRPAQAGQRDRSTIKRLLMYRRRPKRDKHGHVVSGGLSSELPDARIAPNRRWFGNTRVVGQTELAQFRQALGDAAKNPYAVVLRAGKVPWALLNDPESTGASGKKKRKSSDRPDLARAEPFEEVFGPKKQRKRPRLASADLSAMVEKAEQAHGKYSAEHDSELQKSIIPDERDRVRQPEIDKGSSRRIWGELWKVVDSSDVLLIVLDSRDPLGTRPVHLERELAKNAKTKHVVFVLNKCDLVPVWSTVRWVQVLSKEHPTLAFHASITNPFGKGAMIQLLRQLAKLHPDRVQISVGIVGYPNVGKSSLVNTLAADRVCKVAPIPGETKVWQYVRLMRNIYLIDCPGAVHFTENVDEVDRVLLGTVRVENLEDETAYIPALLERANNDLIARTYGIKRTWTDAGEFLDVIARRMGRLKKGGEADVRTAARIVLNDWIRGKIPYFVPPPGSEKPPARTEDLLSALDASVSAAAAAASKVKSSTTQRRAIKLLKQKVAKSDEADEEERKEDGAHEKKKMKAVSADEEEVEVEVEDAEADADAEAEIAAVSGGDDDAFVDADLQVKQSFRRLHVKHNFGDADDDALAAETTKWAEEERANAADDAGADYEELLRSVQNQSVVQPPTTKTSTTSTSRRVPIRSFKDEEVDEGEEVIEEEEEEKEVAQKKMVVRKPMVSSRVLAQLKVHRQRAAMQPKSSTTIKSSSKAVQALTKAKGGREMTAVDNKKEKKKIMKVESANDDEEERRKKEPRVAVTQGKVGVHFYEQLRQEKLRKKHRKSFE